MKNINQTLFHSGEHAEEYFNAVCPPIIQSSNFRFKTLDDFRRAYANEHEEVIYSRGNNPTVNILRQKIAELEGAEDALVFGSGTAAIAATIISQVKSGDHIICVESSYMWTYKLLTNFLPRFGVTHTLVDGTNLEAIEAAIQPNTTLLFLESPTSATFLLQDLKACVDITKKHGLVTAIDNSYCSPIFQNPHLMGVDLVIHSGTKYLNGHSDVMIGSVSGSKEMIKQIFSSEYMNLGAVISPHDAALVIRGLRTLDLRLKKVDESGLKVAQFLEEHPKVEKVIHPFLPSHPQHDLAKTQMRGCGGLFSFYLKTDQIEDLERFFNELKCFTMAVSWGGHESLILPYCAFYNVPGKPNPPIPANLIRLYVGLEEVDWLIGDLEQALEKL